MELEEALEELERFVKKKTTLQPAFMDEIRKHFKGTPWMPINQRTYMCASCGYMTESVKNWCPGCGRRMRE